MYYLLGISLSAAERRAEALQAYRRACELEPDYPLYQVRLAETLHREGRDPHGPIEKALALSPSDPWANNLAGQLSWRRAISTARVPAFNGLRGRPRGRGHRAESLGCPFPRRAL